MNDPRTQDGAANRLGSRELVRTELPMTTAQEDTYTRLREAGYEYSHTEYNGDVFVTLTDRSCDTRRCLATWVIPKDGKAYKMPELFRSNVEISHGGTPADKTLL